MAKSSVQPQMMEQCVLMAAAAPAASMALAAPVLCSVQPVASPPMPQQPQQQPQQQAQQQQQQQLPQQSDEQNQAHVPMAAGSRDYTQVPREMDQCFEKLDTDSALRPTIINPGSLWKKRAQKALLASPTTTHLDSDQQKTEKENAFDLLDALTKSGALPLTHASLHVVVAATHCFDKTVIDTVVEDNVNPIEKIERSTLIMASTIHQVPPAQLIREAQIARVSGCSPQLFLEDAE
eukprot:TRINITY_DN1610_c0_g1_i5.p1 TRINITY_DN1610_c0_g1~~TRINITY_DN1610_c0_g1_i5.p1  ORF type:complete len:245 (-),score=72.89 TRINITY_DN1610_c0_g1_i5:135-842(-)